MAVPRAADPSPGGPARATPQAGGWEIEVSREVEAWYVKLSARERAFADRALDRLAACGPAVPAPHGRSLRDGLYELRFSCAGVQRRVTFAVGTERRIVALTTFRKQRDREDHEIARARKALERERGRDRHGVRASTELERSW